MSGFALKVKVMVGIFALDDQLKESRGCLRSMIFGLCWDKANARRYRRILRTANRKVVKELDLEVYMRRNFMVDTAFAVLFSKE